ncbi:MAG: hypothetical protein LBK52_07715, partial [Deltaproteobacteria bacterium]|nr:hypothetical protein [Deltaproteobacteria bacterium]
MLLRLVRVPPAGCPLLPLTAGLALLVFLAEAVRPYTDNARLFLTLFYFFGLAGVFLTLYISVLRPLAGRSQFRRLSAELRLRAAPWAAPLLLAALGGFLYSVIWPSGEMDIWFNYASDYFTWIFPAEYLIGNIRPETLEISPAFFSWLSLESSGTVAVIAFAGLGHLADPFPAAPAVSVTFCTWILWSVHSLLKGTLGFRFSLSLILTLGPAFNGLFHYLNISGQFGHQLALLTYLVSLSIILSEPAGKPRIKSQLFFPLMLLFFSYQTGYILYSCFLSLALFLRIFLSRTGKPFPARTAAALLGAWGTILWLTFLCSLLGPGLLFRIFCRLQQAAAQTEGWSLPFLSPWFFSGLPFFQEGAFTPNGLPAGGESGPLSYIPLAAAAAAAGLLA